MVEKIWYKSKTYWFNILSFVVLVLSMPELIGVLPSGIVPWVALFGALGNMYLRSITHSPVYFK